MANKSWLRYGKLHLVGHIATVVSVSMLDLYWKLPTDDDKTDKPYHVDDEPANRASATWYAILLEKIVRIFFVVGMCKERESETQILMIC